MVTRLHDSILGSLAPTAASASRHVATKSILNPLLWLAAIITPVSIISSLFAAPPLLYVLIGLAILMPLSVLAAYLVFAVIDRNRLQSEEFVLEQQWIAAQIGDNKSQQVITLEGETAAPAANTALVEGSSNG